MQTFWIVGRFNNDLLPNGNWEALGLFDSEEKAENVCQYPWDFIAPLNLNEDLSKTPTEDWKGLRYPVEVKL